MIALANVLFGIGVVLDMALQFMILLVIIRALVSWVNPDPYNPVVRFLAASTDPLLRPLRRLVPLVGGGIDLSPLVLMFLLLFLKYAVAQTLMEYGRLLKPVVPGF